MKLVRYSQNGQPPRLGMLLGADRVMDLEASAAAYSRPRRRPRRSHRRRALSPREHARVPRGRRRQPGHARRHDGCRQGRQVRAGLVPARDGPAARPDRVSREVHLHRPELQGPRGGDEQSRAQATPVFPKRSNAIPDPGEPVLRPRGEKTLDWEVELGVVIGRTAQFVKRENALDYVFGYTIINDVSARDFQFHTTQWVRARSATHSRRWGRTLRTARRSPTARPRAEDLGQRHPEQNGTTRNFIFDSGISSST